MPNDLEITVLRRVLLLLQVFLHKATEYKVYWDKIQTHMFCRLSLGPAQMEDFRKVVDGCRRLVHGVIQDEDISNCSSTEVKRLLLKFERTFKALRSDISWHYKNLTSRKRLMYRMVRLCKYAVEVHNDLGEIIKQHHSEELSQITQSFGEASIQEAPLHEVSVQDSLLPLFERVRL